MLLFWGFCACLLCKVHMCARMGSTWICYHARCLCKVRHCCPAINTNPQLLPQRGLDQLYFGSESVNGRKPPPVCVRVNTHPKADKNSRLYIHMQKPTQLLRHQKRPFDVFFLPDRRQSAETERNNLTESRNVAECTLRPCTSDTCE